MSSFVPLWCIIEHCCFPKMKWSHFGGGRTFWYHVLHRCCYSLTASKTIAVKSKRHWLDPSDQRRVSADLMSGSPSETICFCPCTVKTRSLGWGTPCWTSQLLWTKISLTSKSKELLLFSGMLHTAVMPPETLCLACSLRSGLDWSPTTRSWLRTNTNPCECKLQPRVTPRVKAA